MRKNINGDTPYGEQTDCVECNSVGDRWEPNQWNKGDMGTLNCYCYVENFPSNNYGGNITPSKNVGNSEERGTGDATFEELGNIYNYLEWLGVRADFWTTESEVFEEIAEYIKTQHDEITKLEQLLTISQGFDPNFKSIITGEPLWPTDQLLLMISAEEEEE